MSLYVAMNQPQRVERLVLLAPASMPQPFPFLFRLLRAPVVGPLFAWTTHIAPKGLVARIGLGRNFYDAQKIRPEDLQEYAHEMRFPGAIGAMRQTAEQLDFRELLGYSEGFGKVKVPTLLLWGENDRIIYLSSGKALHEVMPNSRLFIYPECGHVPHMEYPGMTRDLILDFLREEALATEQN